MSMRIAIVGRERKVVQEYKKEIRKAGIIYTDTKPDIVISLGGDGTLLLAERWFPGIPKIPIRDHSICYKCDWSSLSNVIDKIKKRKYKIEEYEKLEATIRSGKQIHRKLCINDFVIRNTKPIHAIRFDLWINNKKINGILIGDGIVVATPFGATGYYYSITQKSFKKGIGLAFNNMTKPINHLVLNEKAKIKVRIVRSDTTVAGDNDPHVISIKEGDEVEIRKSDKIARIIRMR